MSEALLFDELPEVVEATPGKPKAAVLAGSGLYGNEGDASRTLDHNFFPTPPAATLALIRCLITAGAGPIHWPDFHAWRWWEPACGEGHISKALLADGVDGVISTDLVDRGYGTPGQDFTAAGWPDGADPERTGIFTNPPYDRWLCAEFIRHALEDLRARRVAMLLKATYWHAIERQGLFRRHPPAAIYPLTWRLDFTGAGSPALETAWMVWDQDAPRSPWPPYCPLTKGGDTPDLFGE